jgi:hypothetical protein
MANLRAIGQNLVADLQDHDFSGRRRKSVGVVRKFLARKEGADQLAKHLMLTYYYEFFRANIKKHVESL